MRAYTEVLIVEDDDEERQGLEALVKQMGLYPLPVNNPKAALQKLDHYEPVLAVLDLDMSKAGPSDGKTIGDVLSRLYEQHRNCIPLVYSGKVETIEEQSRVYGFHPFALFVSKRQGIGSLTDRINKLFQGKLGDLGIQAGKIIHSPTKATHQHQVALRLILATRAGQTVPLDDSDARAARRFDLWLQQHSSVVRLRCLRHRQYDLIVTSSSESATEAPTE